MRLPKPLSSLVVCLLFVNFALSSASFMSRGSSEAITTYYVANQSNSSQSKDNASSSEKNYFQLLTFGSFLTNYNFTAFWFNHTENPGTGVIYNHCKANQKIEGQMTALYCSVVSAIVDQHSNTTQTINLYLNESNRYELDSHNSTILFTNVPTKILQKNNSVIALNKTCTADVTYQFVSSANHKPYDYTYDRIGDLAIKVSVFQGDCNLEYKTPELSANTGRVSLSDIYPYILFMAGIAIVQSVACGALVRCIDKNHAVAKRTALGTLCMFISFDFYIYLLHFSYWTSASTWMAVVFILFFILSVFFEPALLYFVFSTLQRRGNNSIMNLLYQLYLWLLVSGGCLILTQTYMPNCLFYAFPFFLVPQIIETFVSGIKYRWNYWLLLGFGVPKLAYIGYLSFHVVSLFEANFTFKLFLYCVGVLTAELVILKIQTKYPRFGLKIFQESTYSYLCELKEIDSLSGVVCSICTEHVKQAPLNGNQQPLMEQDDDNKDIMKTPCQHYYHTPCLKEWFKKKFECPNCREKLPALLDEDD